METWNMKKSTTSLRLDRGHELVDSGIISPVTLTFIVTSLKHCDLDSIPRLLLLDTINVDNLVTRTGPVESLARSDMDPSSSLPLRAMDIKLACRASAFNKQLDGVMTGHQLLCSDPVTFHVSLLCFRGLDLHLLDESDRSE